MNTVRRLLLVDDERAVLEGLKKVLRPWRESWAVDVAEGGRAGQAALESTPYDAVVSDARMPDVDGEAVLRFAAERQPQAIRLVLSGQVDARTGHRLAGVSHQFLVKPTNAQALMVAVEECLSLADSLASPKLREILGKISGLPTAPRAYQRLSALVDNPASSADEVAAVVQTDFSLVTRVLRLVNSPLFGLSRTVESAKEAVVLLGVERLRELVLLTELFSSQGPREVVEAIHESALVRSQVARVLAAGSPVVDLGAEGALLTEVGAHALACGAADYEALWRQAGGGAALCELERAAYGATHVDVGAVLLGLWHLPPAVVNAVRWCRQRPPPGAQLDARTVTALSVALDDEFRSGAPSPDVEALASQLGVESKLETARALFRRVAPIKRGAA